MKEFHIFVLLAVCALSWYWAGESVEMVLCKVMDSPLKLHLKAKVCFSNITL